MNARELLNLLPDSLQNQVVAHTSLVDRKDSNEKLEFLGDAVLGLVVASELFGDSRVENEGHAAKILSQVVSRATCAEIAKEIGLDQELDSRVPRTTNILAGAVEALIGALHSAGVEGSHSLVSRLFYPYIEKALNGGMRDYKTELQEAVARVNPRAVISYSSTETGAHHERRFQAQVTVVSGANDTWREHGEGTRKKDAEQQAAKALLDRGSFS